SATSAPPRATPSARSAPPARSPRRARTARRTARAGPATASRRAAPAPPPRSPASGPAAPGGPAARGSAPGRPRPAILAWQDPGMPQERRPAIVAVDDDPAVLAAVARDLRRGFGDRYRIVRAHSGPEALDLVRQIRARGEQGALLIGDQRMPRMART